uniref:Uncharacterized protein n=1 Tax=Romanomermis culicivorax TaxID=13658 RepID=A0A915INV3_ROMCU
MYGQYPPLHHTSAYRDYIRCFLLECQMGKCPGAFVVIELSIERMQQMSLFAKLANGQLTAFQITCKTGNPARVLTASFNEQLPVLEKARNDDVKRKTALHTCKIMRIIVASMNENTRAVHSQKA